MNTWPACENSEYILIAQAPGEDTAAQTHTSIPANGPEAAGEHGGAEEHEPSPWVFWGYGVIALFILALLSILATRRMRLIPKGIQNFFEFLVESVYGLPEMVMGERGRQYAPFLSTFFLSIVFMNLLGLVPFFKAGTANLNITVGLALIAFVGVQYYGFKAHGIKYLAHFLGPVPIKGNFGQIAATLLLGLLLLPLELLAEFIRPVSLSFRLYGNIFGEEQVIHALATQLGGKIVGLFAPVFLLPLQVLTSILQALVFTLLVTVYITLATDKHDDEEHAH